MSFYNLPVSKVAWLLKQIADQFETLNRVYQDIEYSLRGPYGKGIFLSKEMNAQAKYIHFVNEDHSCRMFVYAAPEEGDMERGMPEFMRTHIFTSPPYFMILSEGAKDVETEPWDEEMRKAGIPDEFIESVRPRVEEATERYRKRGYA